jgi:IS30 family transposase
MTRPYRRRKLLSVPEQNTLWEQRRRGATSTEIAEVVGTVTPTVRLWIVRQGGVAPAARRRARLALSLGEREEISRGIAAQESVRAIARRLGRSPGTISREIRRNDGRGHYRASRADRRAWAHAARPKRCRLAQLPRLCAVVTAKLGEQWSPEQIAGWLRRTYPDEPLMQVSHETIYRTLYIQARGVLKQELTAHLRRRRRVRQSRGALARGARQGHLIDIVSISERPPSAADRAVPGHWEGDLLMGGKGSQIATLVERRSRFVLLARIPRRDSATVVRVLARRIQRLPAKLKQSLTWDRGKEMAQHKAFTVATDVQVYFCDPHSPWQRGSNENTNGLLRQYFPTGMDLTTLTQRELDVIARKLNTRPRETLDWNTPADVFAATVASTG